jgi:hypothetical protein
VKLSQPQRKLLANMMSTTFDGVGHQVALVRPGRGLSRWLGDAVRAARRQSTVASHGGGTESIHHDDGAADTC